MPTFCSLFTQFVMHIAIQCSANSAIFLKIINFEGITMTKTIAVINQKGGVGKTATAYNLAAALSVNGKRTLLIDFDPSGNASRGLVSDIDEVNVLTISELLRDHKLDPCLAILPSVIQGREMPNLYLIPAKISLAKTQRDMIVLSCKEIRLERHLQKIRHKFDYIIIDCLPTFTELTVNAIFSANFILIPISYEKDALEGMSDLFEIITDIKDNEDAADFDYKILRNKYDARKRVINTYVKDKLQPFIEKGVVFETIIPQDEEINKAKLNYEPVITFAPNSSATKHYNALMKELIEYA